MKYPLPTKVLFGFITVLTIMGIIVKISFGTSLTTILLGLLPTAAILYMGFRFVRYGQKKRENYYGKFSDNE